MPLKDEAKYRKNVIANNASGSSDLNAYLRWIGYLRVREESDSSDNYDFHMESSASECQMDQRNNVLDA